MNYILKGEGIPFDALTLTLSPKWERGFCLDPLPQEGVIKLGLAQVAFLDQVY